MSNDSPQDNSVFFPLVARLKLKKFRARVIALLYIAIMPLIIVTTICLWWLMRYCVAPAQMGMAMVAQCTTMPYWVWAVIVCGAMIYTYLLARDALARLDYIRSTIVRSLTTNQWADDGEAQSISNDMAQFIGDIEGLSSEAHKRITQYQQIHANMTHELRNPLHTVGLAIDSMRAQVIAPTPQMLGLLYGEIQRVHRLVDDMQTLSLLDLDKFQITPQALPIADIVRYVVSNKSVIANAQHITLVVEPSDESLIFTVDPDRVIQALMNIVDNAIRHSQPQRQILLAYGSGDNDLWIRVSDAGTGIAADELSHLFTRFYRGSTPRGQGSGLGLAIVQAIVRAHGGVVTIDSTVGVGTAVTIHFPVR
jgi:two-component system sensor histidine kinase BaeS